MSEKRQFVGRQVILQAQDLPVEELEVPEWGGWVRVKTLTAAERDAFENDIIQRNGRDVKTNVRNIRAKLVAVALVDETGRPLFTLADVEALGQKSAKALDRCFAKASELAGMRESDVQEMAETFVETPGAA
jgi:hypothetical protein